MSGYRPSPTRKTPLSDPNLEQAHLAALIHNPGLITTIVAHAGRDDIYESSTRTAIWRGITEMSEKGMSVDPTSLSAYIVSKGYLSELEVAVELEPVAFQRESGTNLESWTDLLISIAQKREGISISTDAGIGFSDANKEYDEIASEIAARLEKNSRVAKAKSISTIAGDMKDVFLAHYAGGISGLSGMSTGIPEVDNILGGVEPDDYITIGARTGVGKTLLANQISRYPLLTDPRACVVTFSLEMSEERILRRHVASISGVQMRKIRKGEGLTPQDVAAIEMAFDLIRNDWGGRLFIFTKRHFPGGFSIAKMRQLLRALKARLEAEGKHIALWCLDNIHVVPYKDLNAFVHNSIGCKECCQELEIPGLIVAQLRRDVEKENRPPRISDIKESAQVEQDSDRIILIDRPITRNAHLPPEELDRYQITESDAQLHIPKNREDEPGVVDCDFDKIKLEFTSRAIQRIPSQSKASAIHSMPVLDLSSLDSVFPNSAPSLTL